MMHLIPISLISQTIGCRTKNDDSIFNMISISVVSRTGVDVSCGA